MAAVESGVEERSRPVSSCLVRQAKEQAREGGAHMLRDRVVEWWAVGRRDVVV